MSCSWPTLAVARCVVYIGEETTECYQCYTGDFHSEGSFLEHNRDRYGDRLFSKGRRPVLPLAEFPSGSSLS